MTTTHDIIGRFLPLPGRGGVVAMSEGRWSRCVLKYLHWLWRTDVGIIVTMGLFVLFIILPLACRHLPYSYYVSRNEREHLLNAEASERASVESAWARRYMRTAGEDRRDGRTAGEDRRDGRTAGEDRRRSEVHIGHRKKDPFGVEEGDVNVGVSEYLEEGVPRVEDYEERALRARPETTSPKAPGVDLAIVVVTIGRREHYLTRVVTALHHLLTECGSPCRQHHLAICNVDPRPRSHTEALDLAPLAKVFSRLDDEMASAESERAGNVFEKEKQDYVFCLRWGLNLHPQNVVLLEDDAVPQGDFFPVLHHILTRRAAQRALYLKLYHPERLQGYLHPEPARHLEWLGLGLMGAYLLYAPLYAVVHPNRHLKALTFLVLVVMIMLAAELVGRFYILELRRLSPHLYSLAPASECCTPGMVFSSAGGKLALELLLAETCRQGHAKDMALYVTARQSGKTALVVEPNLVSHIGEHSSLNRAL
uniref:post-GPI attachment to proteins factor 4 n=1 Tax=Myxine glutinosa TaxID=7769 RepID=UPI00358F9C93